MTAKDIKNDADTAFEGFDADELETLEVADDADTAFEGFDADELETLEVADVSA
ncbi:hypothetical protein [Streptomyces sp. NRRL S-37]|uniref:hypothetical protein n=1 Tax=Streptomyces sp. NRRL S-37 TaxID=1463903 RepID=UPI000AE938FE|nr:hypothetical protein [Streptomyces sp. NRRL S-37]